MKRNWTIKIGILVLLIVFGIYLRLHKRSSSYIRRYRLLNIADSTEISGIKITRGSDTIILHKKGGNWVVVVNGRELPADKSRVESIAGKFAGAEYQLAGLNVRDVGAYGINDTSSMVVTISTIKGNSTTLVTGKRGPVYSSFYFVFPDRKKIYILYGVSPYILSSKPENYRDKNVVNLKPEDIKSLIVVSGKDSLKITRSGDTLVSEPATDTATIKAVINRARVLTAFGFADDLPDSVTGLTSSTKKIVFVTQQDDTLVITVGNKGEHALFVGLNKRPGEVFKVYLSWFDEVLKKAGILTDFKK